jgi:uncharacterized RDD family membrane protein YckC
MPKQPAVPDPTVGGMGGLGGWLGGPGALPDGSMRITDRISLPEIGPGSAVGSGRKAAGLILDLVAATLIGRAIVLAGLSGVWAISNAETLAFLLEVWLLQATTGQSIGQRITKTRIVAVNGGQPGPWWLFLRTVLMVCTLFLLCLITDRDGRGIHDKAAGTIVVSSV